MEFISEKEKAALRRERISARNALTEADRQNRSAAIVERILALDAFRKAAAVLIYRSVAGEVCLDSLPVRVPNKRYAYPRCLKGREMSALVPFTPDAFSPGAYGIPEPDPNRSFEVAPWDIDLVLCPCTAFDDGCTRLGMGGGYYDRFLPRCRRATILAVAFEVQRADKVPTAPWDWPVDGVITEERVLMHRLVSTSSGY